LNYQLQAWDTNDLTDATTSTITLSGAPCEQESIDGDGHVHLSPGTRSGVFSVSIVNNQR
jgi:hypothetical protein